MTEVYEDDVPPSLKGFALYYPSDMGVCSKCHQPFFLAQVNGKGPSPCCQAHWIRGANTALVGDGPATNKYLAFHEAGHAVVALVLGWKLRHVTTVTSAEAFGLTSLIWPCDFDEFRQSLANRDKTYIERPSTQKIVRELAVIRMAGPVAGLRGSGGEDHPFYHNEEWVATYDSISAALDTSDPAKFRDWAMQTAVSILDESWTNVQDLANALDLPVELSGDSCLEVLSVPLAARLIENYSE